MRAFPNALLEGADNLPIALSSIKEIPVDVKWTYGIGNSNETSTDEATLVANSKFLSLLMHLPICACQDNVCSA